MPGGRETLWGEIATWIGVLTKAGGVSSHTAQVYRQCALRFAAWLHARRRGACATDITREDAIDYRAALLTQGVSAGTINRHLTALRLFVDQAAPERPNPFREIPLAPPHDFPSSHISRCFQEVVTTSGPRTQKTYSANGNGQGLLEIPTYRICPHL